MSPAAKHARLVASNLFYAYEKDKTAVDRVSFTVEKGQITGLLGPNGAGKSTTLRLLTGVLYMQDGRVELNGYDLRQHPRKGRGQVGYLPENPGIYPDITVREYLTFMARAHSMRNKRHYVEMAAERTACHQFLERPMEKLSKGQRQRSFLAGAMIHDPAVLILDEPTDGLDPNQKVEMHKVMKELAKDKAILLSTHQLDEVETMCSRVMVMNKGHIVHEGTLKSLTKLGKGNIGKAFHSLTMEGADNA